MKTKSNTDILWLSLLLSAFVALVWLQSFLSQRFFANQKVALERQYTLLVALIFFFMALAALALVWLLRKYKYREKPWLVLSAAYGLPLLATAISFTWLMFVQAPILAGGLAGSLFRATWQPFLYFWQVMVLFFSLRLLFPVRQISGIPLQKLPAAVLSGLGCGVVSVFILSVLLNWSNQAARSLAAIDPPAVLRWVTMALALSVAPFAAEGFFRQILLSGWQARFGGTKGFWMVAGLFAFLTFQPALWLPALISGVAFSLLVRYQSLTSAMIAHAVANAVLLIVGWQWVF
ncbi:MAG: hypothetical protein BGO78_14265 [Chloroflexi bacterium 44-23]|nr:MAG: hypothetical protein BGO78_14265 [Chloroflexi bacterium 44-23]